MEFRGTKITTVVSQYKFRLVTADIIRYLKLAGQEVPDDTTVQVNFGPCKEFDLDDGEIIVTGVKRASYSPETFKQEPLMAGLMSKAELDEYHGRSSPPVNEVTEDWPPLWTRQQAEEARACDQ